MITAPSSSSIGWKVEDSCSKGCSLYSAEGVVKSALRVIRRISLMQSIHLASKPHL